MTMETVRFFGWLISSVVVSTATLIGVYSRLYIHDALQAQMAAIQEIMAKHYVRRELHDEQIRRLEAMIEAAR